MVRQVEAVFENGVLRPVEPLSLPEKQHVILTLTDVSRKEDVRSRKAEQEWLSAHGHEYVGQWVALEGDALISHGPKAVAVRDEAQQKGVERPLMVYIPKEFGEPSAGWF
jgi:predicted DNA-binding antitoxin AbrB/MazE fold protein